MNDFVDGQVLGENVMTEAAKRMEKLVTERAKQRFELKELERLGMSPDIEERYAILAYISLLLKNNKTAELIPAADENQMFLRHFIDSLQLLLLLGFKKNATVLDIGSGGGFPSIPIRIFRPDLSFVLTESVRKKSAFLREVVDALEFDNVEVHAGKVENLKTDKKFDYVISRGMPTLHRFAELATPFLDRDGHMYSYKTKQFIPEIDAITAGKAEGGKIQIGEIAQYDLGSLIHGLNLVSLTFVN